MDKLSEATPTRSHVTKGPVTSTPVPLSQAVLQLSPREKTQSRQHSPPTENGVRKHLENNVDVLIRVAFIDFLFNVDILGLIDQYICIYRYSIHSIVCIVCMYYSGFLDFFLALW